MYRSTMLISVLLLALLAPSGGLPTTKAANSAAPLPGVPNHPFQVIAPGSAVERIAFDANRDGNSEIYVMNADGSNQTRLTTNLAADGGATWSPDGARIAFESRRDGNPNVYAMNADGSNQTRLTTSLADDGGPAWSPDGARIAFNSTRDGNAEIYVMNVDGSNPTRLTINTAGDYAPTWSPDGRRIAFHSYRDGNPNIYVMNADGSNQTRLTINTASNGSPSWSPDGRQIAFDSYSGGNGDIYVINADGSSQTRLTINPAGDFQPAWSPDGTRIAFHSSRDGNYEIYAMNADGSSQTRLTTDVAGDFAPAWSQISLQCRTVGRIKVCADTFAGNASSWTASGTATIGDYTLVENASLSANGSSLSQTSVQWNTSAVPAGAYYVYALLDDPFSAPVAAYSAAPVPIIDDTPPPTPAGLQVRSIGSDATIAWQPSAAADVAGYRIYYREPGSGHTFVADVPDGQRRTYTQQGLYLNGNWEVAISAYDINNNESARSAAVFTSVRLHTVYLPLTRR